MTEIIDIDAGAANSVRSPDAGCAKALVLGDDTRSFLATVRSLGRRGIQVHVAPADMQSPALRSRYVARVHQLPPYTGDGTEWVRAVCDLLAVERFELVIPCQDTTLLPFHAHRELFEPLARLAIPDPAAIDVLFDKEKTKALAARLGVNVARSIDPEDCGDAEEIFGTLGAPVVVKPKNSFQLDELHRRGVVQIVDTPRQLTRATASLGTRSYYVEEFFRGRGVGLSVLADRGEIVLAFQHHRVHEGSGGGAAPYRISAAIAPELRAACEKIVGYLGFTGVAMFEFRRNFESGRWILLEINARPWGSLPLPIALGVDFPFAWYRLLVHAERPKWRDYPVGVYGRNLGLDIQFLLGELSEAHGLAPRAAVIVRWLGSFFHVFGGFERDDTIVRDDPRPGLIEIRALFSNYAKRAAKLLPFSQTVERAIALHSVQRALHSALARDGCVKLVFICFGNICRSPFAEGVAAKLLAPYRDRVTIASAGIYPVSGRASPSTALAAAQQFGVDLTQHRSQSLTDITVADATIIFVFDERNREGVWRQFATLPCPVISLGLLTVDSGLREIKDPFGGAPGDFDRCYKQIESAARTVRHALAEMLQRPDPPVLKAPARHFELIENPKIRFSIRRSEEVANLAELWRNLEARSDASFFLTWDWIGCWCAEADLARLVVVGECNGRVVLLGLLHPTTYRRHGLINAQALLLNQAGDPELDSITIEYNGFLADRECAETAVRECLKFLQSPEAMMAIGHRWDEIQLGGVSEMFETAANDTGLTLWLRARKPSWQVNLDAVRQSSRPYLDHLSANTRYQIRRSMRLYEKHGVLTARRAADVAEAMQFYAEMQELHQRYWISRGQPGAYSSAFYGRFHRELLKRCLPAGTVELVRVAAGEYVIGYVYNFVYRGWVCAYQTGLTYDSDPKLKPGLVAHYLCIERHLREGARSYDLLAGDARYKQSLGTPGPDMIELTLQRRLAKLRVESALRRVKRTFTSTPLET